MKCQTSLQTLRMRLKQRGKLAAAYTLTEMLVVLVIIGLLAAVVGPRLFSRLDDAKQRTARLQLASLSTALDLFQLDMGRLPTAEEGLDALVTAPADAGEVWLGPYLARDALPLDPWGRPYLYTLDPESARPRILSHGADGRLGGTGSAEDVVVEIGASDALAPAQDSN
jgi:general secretion pathway protein G